LPFPVLMDVVQGPDGGNAPARFHHATRPCPNYLRPSDPQQILDLAPNIENIQNRAVWYFFT